MIWRDWKRKQSKMALHSFTRLGNNRGAYSKDIRKTYPGIPWQDSAGRREKLRRDYFDADIEKVWGTAREDLPVWKEQVVGIRKDFGFE